MALSRWSLDRLLRWIGTISLVALFVPMGLLLAHNVLVSTEESLSQRGESLARITAGQIVEPMLVDDHPALLDALQKAASADDEVRYLCIEEPSGAVAVHTFGTGYPRGLTELWKGNPGQIVPFRTGEDSLLDIPSPILHGQLGTLHVGISRSKAIQAGDQVLWPLGIGLAAALSAVLVGARLVASRVSRPLRELEARVSLLPQQDTGNSGSQISGTHEVEALARGFEDMIRRLDALERDRAATHERMVHAERLAALGEMAAGLAHEVHNPLDGMMECLRYLDADPGKGQRAAKYHPMLWDGLERIAKVMREMLTFARSGRDVSVKACDVQEMVGALGLLVDSNLKGRRVRLTWRVTGACQCLCDSQGLAQAG
ncbi:MAG: sensor histidine kinase, partial [Planctomycetota bacterium]